jgi:hypothetical protein
MYFKLIDFFVIFILTALIFHSINHNANKKCVFNKKKYMNEKREF